MNVRPRWGRRVDTGLVAGHPCKVYVDRPRSLAELLLDAMRWDDREFLVQGERRLTGRNHAYAVSAVAARLRQHGIRAGDGVMILGYNSVEWLVSFWALQSLGATAILGNAWWSDTETLAAIEQARPVLILTDRPADRLAAANAPVLRFDAIRVMSDNTPPSDLVVAPVDEEAPALIIFSSGTTGQAKGVVMSHRCVIANIQNLLLLTGRLPSELHASHPGTVSLLSMPLFHLAGMQVSIMTMLSGGKLIFLEGRFDPEQVLALIQQEKVRAWGSVPTMVSRVIQHPRFAEYDTASVSSVQMGGAAIPHELRARVQQAFPRTRKRVGSMYGFTEAGGVLAAGSGSDVEGRPGCVGRPLPAVEIEIRNPDDNGVGEIAARAPTATSGYLNEARPLLDGEGWILSGDLGRFDQEGYLYVVGRSKDTIIRGGENIAAGHVEDSLRTHPAVHDIAVVPLPHPDLGEEVGAAVVLKPGAQVTVEALRQHAASQLARFEVPSRWWLIEGAELPVNASGKVVKREVIARWPADAETGR